MLTRNNRRLAMEVKSNADTFNKGLSLFRQRFQPEAAMVVGPGGYPPGNFLLTDPDNLFCLSDR